MGLSKHGQKALEYYLTGKWNEQQLRNVMAKGYITKAELEYILAQKPEEAEAK